MISRKINSVFSNKPNLKNVSVPCKLYSTRHYLTVCEVSASKLFEELLHAKNNMKILIENGRMLQILKDTLFNIPRTLKHQSAGVLRIWAHQCECVLAQRLRRGQQMFCLYTRLWEEHALKDLLLRMQQQISRNSKELMFSACGIAVYNWEANRISDEDLKTHMIELDYIQLLKEKTLYCEVCKKRSCSVAQDCCVCRNKQNQKRVFDKWIPFIEKKDIVVWRRLHHSGNGHYEYKVYGSFNDVSAEDFLNVQIDSEYRKKWDTTAIMLEVVDCDPNPQSNSEVVYWEMLWPRLFVNRDYVFNRRFLVDGDSNTVVIVSRGTDHPACPIRSDKYRVNDYWSEMVIKSYTDIDKPGIEFGLTYFDNPGVNIPATVTTWVAIRAMPDFLMRLRRASIEYKLYCEKNKKQFIYSCAKPIPKGKNKKSERNRNFVSEMEDIIIDNTIFEPQHPLRGKKPPSSQYRLHDVDTVNENTENCNTGYPSSNFESNSMASSTVIKSEMTSHDYWKYFKPNYYFT